VVYSGQWFWLSKVILFHDEGECAIVWMGNGVGKAGFSGGYPLMEIDLFYANDDVAVHETYGGFRGDGLITKSTNEISSLANGSDNDNTSSLRRDFKSSLESRMRNEFSVMRIFMMGCC